MKRILIAEDDFDLGTSLSQYLKLKKFDVQWAKNGEEALQFAKAENGHFDIFILDVMMPIMDGFTLAKQLVSNFPDVPFLFLTARKTTQDKLKGLKLGADDYIEKPFEVEELVLRIKNIIKRTQQENKLLIDIANHDKTPIGKYVFDGKNLELIFGQTVQKLTEKEAQLIYFFSCYPNQLIPREDILKKVWNNTDFFSGRSMDVFISRVRKLLSKDENISIKSIRGVGLEFGLKSS